MARLLVVAALLVVGACKHPAREAAGESARASASESAHKSAGESAHKSAHESAGESAHESAGESAHESAGESAHESAAAVPAPLSCRTLQSCTDSCADSACAEACARRLTAAARPAYDALQACVAPACANRDGGAAPCREPGSFACKMCVLSRCATQAAACMSH